MTAGRTARLERVWRVVHAARRLVATRAAILPAIAAETGLSPEGVELAFTRHLETCPCDADLGALLDAAGDAPHVAVLLSANVFLAALRAIALARAASADVVVRPSRRAPTFARALVEEVGEPGLRLVAELEPARLLAGELHVYGRDETVAAVRAAVRAGPVARAGASAVRVVGHGAGMGVAFVSAAANPSVAAASLAEDVIVFDQRGCLSPRVVLVEGGPARAERFARALHGALEEADVLTPRGALDEHEREAATRYRATMAFAGQMYAAQNHAVGLSEEGAPLVVPPTGRHVHVAPAEDARAARALLAPLARFVVGVGSDDLARAADLSLAHARLSLLGAMQRPPLDGPVDRRPSAE